MQATTAVHMAGALSGYRADNMLSKAQLARWLLLPPPPVNPLMDLHESSQACLHAIQTVTTGAIIPQPQRTPAGRQRSRWAAELEEICAVDGADQCTLPGRAAPEHAGPGSGEKTYLAATLREPLTWKQVVRLADCERCFPP